MGLGASREPDLTEEEVHDAVFQILYPPQKCEMYTCREAAEVEEEEDEEGQTQSKFIIKRKNCLGCSVSVPAIYLRNKAGQEVIVWVAPDPTSLQLKAKQVNVKGGASVGHGPAQIEGGGDVQYQYEASGQAHVQERRLPPTKVSHVRIEGGGSRYVTVAFHRDGKYYFAKERHQVFDGELFTVFPRHLNSTLGYRSAEHLPDFTGLREE